MVMVLVPEKVRALPSSARLPLFLYRNLFPVAFLLMLPSFAARMFRRGNYRLHFGQRFGLFSKEARERLSPGGWTWIHAVSVGEMMMALKLARMLREKRPGLRLLVSTTTSTGFALARDQIARERAAGEDGLPELIYYPVDLAFNVRRVLDFLRPAQLILVDKELWPNMISECHRRAIPISIVNARLSPRSERGFFRWRRWVGPFFAMVDRVCVQEPEEIERWARLGVRREALHCTGSLKFDFTVPSGSRAFQFRRLLEGLGVATDGEGGVPILLGGSTFAGEEATLGRVFLALRKRRPDLFLILVPRHAERTAEVEAVLRGLGLSYVLRSAVGEGTPGGPRPDVLLVNSTGELRDWYAVATVCFIGKSLATAATGGQNPAEPLLAGRPVVFGPRMENFSALVRQFLEVGGAVQVRDEAGLAEAFERLLDNPQTGAAMVAAARTVLQRHEGATGRTANLLLAGAQADRG